MDELAQLLKLLRMEMRFVGGGISAQDDGVRVFGGCTFIDGPLVPAESGSYIADDTSSPVNLSGSQGHISGLQRDDLLSQLRAQDSSW